MDNLIYPQMKILETQKCILRCATLDDANDIYECYKDEKVVEFLPFDTHKNIDDSKKFIQDFFIDSYKKHKIGHFVIVYKENNKVIGNIGFNNIKTNAKIGEIGICINPFYWKENLSTDLANQVIKFGFSEVGLKKIIAMICINNKYPNNIIDKLKFKYKGIRKRKLKNHYINCHRYELTAVDYYKF